MNLVAPVFRLAGLPKNDPAFERLCTALEAFPVPRQHKVKLVEKLAGVDHLGTLLQVDDEIQTFLEQGRGALRPGGKPNAQDEAEARETLRLWFGEFLDAHAARAELGLRLDGEQVAAGVRFLEIVRDRTYDVVMGNPPYLGLSKLAEGGSFAERYPAGRADLFACFYLRALQLAKPGGTCGFITLSNWMFLTTYASFRREVFLHELVVLADLGKSAFSTGGTLISTACAVIRRRAHASTSHGTALRPHAPEEVVRDDGQPRRTQAALLAQRGRYEFDVTKLSGIEGTPLVYWWAEDFLAHYVRTPKLGQLYESRKGTWTSDNTRFLRVPHEVVGADFHATALRPPKLSTLKWLAYVGGAKGQAWVDSLVEVVNWENGALELKLLLEHKHGVYPQGTDFFFRRGIAFSQIGASFGARVHRYAGAFGGKGSSVFPDDIANTLCLMNSGLAKWVLNSLNPGVGFELGDVARLHLQSVALSDQIFGIVEAAFELHESQREPSVEFKLPGGSPWRYAQAWAQTAIDRAEGAPLPPYVAEYDPADPITYVSFAVGVALGRFAANGEGIRTAAPTDALSAGILYLTGSESLPDSLSHPAAARIATAWAEHGSAILNGDRRDLRDWLRDKFFAYHKTLYENRPIYFPLSSAKKNFVAFISIHRWTDTTLQTLLADHLRPNLRQLDAAIEGLREARASSTRATASGADRQYTQLKRLRDELADFIAAVTECAERGAPPAPGGPPRAADAPFHMDLDDGVMINSAALWPLLEPQWKDPKKWWKELCEAKGRKDYDWAHLAARYFPKRVDEKCRVDPSLAVAHGCFWRYHPAKAYAWELRLAYEIGPDFAIDEPDAAEHRAGFLAAHAKEAEELLQKERDRRERLRRREADAAEASRPGLARTTGNEDPENDVIESEDDDEQVAV